MAKIGIFGPHGAGKTTLCHGCVANLRRLGHDVGLVREVARYCPFSLSENQSEQQTIRTLKWLANTQENWELEEYEIYDHLICDRTIIDRAAYAIAVLGEEKASPFICEAEWWLQSYPYDVLFQAAPNPEYLKRDKLRSLNSDFHKRVCSAFDIVIQNLSIKFYSLPTERAVSFVIDLVAPGLDGCRGETT